MTAPSLPLVPQWTNPRIVLYHGTTDSAARSICDAVDLNFGSSRKDFGRGFYTTTWKSQAKDWADRAARRMKNGERPRVVRLTLDRNILGSLETLAFIRGARDAHDYWNFVRHCRKGLPHRSINQAYYDVVYGPVAVLWENPLLRYVIANFDQISFHTAAAQSMLNNSSCTKEIVQ